MLVTDQLHSGAVIGGMSLFGNTAKVVKGSIVAGGTRAMMRAESSPTTRQVPFGQSLSVIVRRKDCSVTLEAFEMLPVTR